MTSVLAWLLLAVMVAVPVVLVLLGLRRQSRGPDQAALTALVKLYEIRRRQDVALFRVEARQAAARARRELHRDLDRLDREARGR